MSTATIKRGLREAIDDAYAFRDLFAGTYERWEVAGSVRRRKAEVSDVEHVVIPRLDAPDLFGVATRNALLARADELVEQGWITRHVYSLGETGNAPIVRWGDLYRGCDFRGFNHEIFSADRDNWGSVLAIRTGPADFSRALVTALRRNGHRNVGGRVWRCDRCPAAEQRQHEFPQLAHGNVCLDDCPHCQGTGLHPEAVVPTLAEQQFFALAGMAWREPERRW